MYAVANLAQQLADTQNALLFVASVVVILSCCWMAEDTVKAAIMRMNGEDVNYCPLHKVDAKVCAPYHRDED